MSDPLSIIDLSRMEYRAAWALQEQAHSEVLAGGGERVFLVEHSPVVTFGRRGDCERNLLVAPEILRARGIDVVQSDRGGDITFHGPGQIVAYPIIRLADHGFSVSGYVHGLEKIVIALLAELGIESRADPKAVGVWARAGAGDSPENWAKIAAIGVRIRRGVTLHGLALNVSTDLRYFENIVPCGLADRAVTSIARIKGEDAAGMDLVKGKLNEHLTGAFTRRSDRERSFATDGARRNTDGASGNREL